MGNRQSKKKWTIEEIDRSDRLLFLLGKKVIDATDVLDNHPGGNEILLKNKGTEITLALWIHSKPTQERILQLIVGSLKGKK